MSDEHRGSEAMHDEIKSYAGGEIQARHGIVNRWLLVLYLVLFIWSIDYLAGPFEGGRPTFEIWGAGALGPGLSREPVEQGLQSLPVVIAFWIVVIAVLAFFAWVIYLAWKK